jgi:serine/threonine protein kinase
LGLFKNNIHSIKKISINEAHDNNTYCFIKALGYGGFGKVFLAKEKYPNCLVAIKQLLNSTKSEQADIIHEIEIVSNLKTPML